MNTLIIVAAILISLAIGIPVGMVIRKKIAESKIEGARSQKISRTSKNRSRKFEKRRNYQSKRRNYEC